MSSRRRMLNRGRWRLMNCCSASSASASVSVTRKSIEAIWSIELEAAARRLAGEVAGDALADRGRLADVDDLARRRRRTGRRPADRAACLRCSSTLDPVHVAQRVTVRPAANRASRSFRNDHRHDPLAARARNALSIEIDGEIGTLTLDRPDSLNAMSPELIFELTVASGLARRPGAAARPDRHRRRRARVLLRRRRELVQGRRRRPGASTCRRTSAAAPRCCTRRSSTSAASPIR